MAIVPRVTIEEYKDWHRRYELKCPLPPDDKLQEGLDRANKRAQEIEDEKEARKLCQSNSEVERRKLNDDFKSGNLGSCTGSNPVSDNIPVYPIKYPAPESATGAGP